MAETKLPSLLCYAQTWGDRSLRGQSNRGQSQQRSEIVKTNLDERSLRILSCLKQTYIWALHCVSQYIYLFFLVGLIFCHLQTKSTRRKPIILSQTRSLPHGACSFEYVQPWFAHHSDPSPP